LGIIEIGALATAVLAVVNLSGRIIKLITAIQTLIKQIDGLQEEMTNTKELWIDVSDKCADLDQRLTHIEYNLAIV